MPQPVIIGAVAMYGALLFLIAWLADRRAGVRETTLQKNAVKQRSAFSGNKPSNSKADVPSAQKGGHGSAVIYGLSLAVYCTSWTFYGAVGTASEHGWEYLPIYLGPILMFSIGLPVIKRIVETGRRIGSTSIADFISYHFGKSRAIAVIISMFAVIGALPYIALQLNSVTSTFRVLAGERQTLNADGSALAAVAFLLAVFAILFGTKNMDVTKSNRGMVAAIAFDAVIKLIALLIVAFFALWLSRASISPLESFTTLSENKAFSFDRFLTLTVLAMGATLCLPRQFQMTVVENLQPNHLKTGSRIFIGYLILISVAAPPIAALGAIRLTGTPSDLFVLNLPLAAGVDWLAVIVFIGGFAAATGMVIVATVALSTMVTNDLIAPAFLHTDLRRGILSNLGQRLLFIRRAVILVILAGAALFAGAAPQTEGLASFGILSFAAAAQFLPALFGGLYWRHANDKAAAFGLVIGAILWTLLLLIPSITPAFLDLSKQNFVDPLTLGVAISLGANTVVFVGLSLAFETIKRDTKEGVLPRAITSGDLYFIIERCIGRRDADAAISAFEMSRGLSVAPDRLADQSLIAFTDVQISKSIGASSASILLKSVLAGDRLELADVATLLGETSGKLSFSQELLQTALENINHGVSVVDKDLRLVAWNQAYADLYNYPLDLLTEGRPVADLIRFNAERGECGTGYTKALVSKRVEHLKRGLPHSFERTRANGQVIKIEGKRSPSGAYVTTFTDVTDYNRIVGALRNSERSIRFYTDNIPAMIAFSDVNETIQFANEAYRDEFDIKEDDIGSVTLKGAMGDPTYALRKPYIDKALAGEKASFDVQITNPTGQSDDTRYMQVVYVPQRRENGDVRGFFGMYQDITARRVAEEALAATNETLEERVAARTIELEDLNTKLEMAKREAEQATASKTRFLAAASHDVLQPLNAARLFASALNDAHGKNRRDLAQKIDASIASADALLRSLLNISKLDAGGITPNVTTIPLQEIFDDIERDIGRTAEEKGLSLRIPRTSVAIETDRGLFFSALQNLAANAVRYTDSGRVLIGARRRGGNIRIEVRDTGPGIPFNNQKAIFEEFKRLETRGEGAGLGLAMVERISRLLNLGVTLVSEPGKGSCFSIDVRRAESVPITKVSSLHRERPRVKRLSGMHIICIDNDTMVADAMVAALTRWGAKAEAVATADEALALSQKSAPDLLILDFQLDNGFTGFDALQTLTNAWQTQPPCLMVTASSSHDTAERAAAAGIPLLYKPVEPAELRAAIDGVRRVAAE
ncbi:MAG: PAS-domain containing protein [Pseudomonadota bacterium]